MEPFVAKIEFMRSAARYSVLGLISVRISQRMMRWTLRARKGLMKD